MNIEVYLIRVASHFLARSTMLRCYILFIFLLCYDAQGVSVQSTNDDVYFSDRMENIIKKKCLENADQTKRDEALDGLHHFIHGWQIFLPKNQLIDEDLYNNCIEKSKNFTLYLETFVEKITPCLEAEEQYLKQFILDSYGDHNHYFCKSLTVTGLSKIKQNQCSDKFSEHPETNPLVACYKNSKIFGNASTLGVITKQKLCEDLTSIHVCYEEMFEKHCSSSPEIRDLRMILITQALENCTK